MKRLISRTLPFLSAATLMCALAGCGAKHKDETLISLPPVEVRVDTVENKPRSMTEEVLGTVRAKLHATLEARLRGHIEQMPVGLGEMVQKGQLIARLDAGEVMARLDQAKASLEEADRDWKRTSTLFGQQSATRAEYDSAQARQQIAQGVLAEAKVMMSYVSITAPFSGVVTKKWADVGDLAAPGKPLLDLEDPTALQLQADVPEALIANVKLDDQLAVHLESVTNEMVGTVTEMSPIADPNSRTFPVKLDLANEPGLQSGQFGRVALPIGEVSAIRVPAAAVILRGQMELVFVVADGHALLRLVKTGAQVGDEVEVLSGLNAGETVVTDGAAALTDGQPVIVKP